MTDADRPQAAVVHLLSRALQRIRATPPRVIASPPTQPRRAAVALIIRVVPPPNYIFPSPSASPSNTPLPSLPEFFEQDWVKDPNARPEILFLHRTNDADRPPSPAHTYARSTGEPEREAHVAFPGGRTEPDDEGGLYTAMRQTWEEIGIDLAERCYSCIGQLDDREITTSLGKRLLMILSPYVFLQLTPSAPPPDPTPSTTLHWVPLASLVSLSSPTVSKNTSKAFWSTVTVDAASRIAPKNSMILRFLIRWLFGTMEFPAIVLESSYPSSHNITEKEKSSEKRSRAHDIVEKGYSPTSTPPKRLKLWGLSLGMMLDLLSYMMLPQPPSVSPSPPSLTPSTSQRNGINQREDNYDMARTATPLAQYMHLPQQNALLAVSPEEFRVEYVAPSLASVFPRFSYPDVNFWIWVFGKRYREVIRGWEASLRQGGVNDRRINWSGSALSTFYAAIRKALIVVVVLRALGIIFGLALAGWWIFR